MTVSVLMVASGEPAERLQRAVRAVRDQRDVQVAELLLAVPPGEVEAVVAALGPSIPPVRVIPNPGGRRSPGLNRAMQAATCSVVARVDARSILPPDYLIRCATRLLADPSVGVVGGVQAPRPTSGGATPRGIYRALSNPWALGGAPYRRGGSGPVDTVYLGVFRRDELVQLGGWDERLDANEDFELCQRYRQRGSTVWLEERVEVSYEARARLGPLGQQYRALGRSKVVYWRLTGAGPNARQSVAVVLGLTVPLGALLIWRRWPRLAAAGAGALVAAVAAADQVVVGGRPRASERFVALTAYLVIWSAWLGGLAEESIRELRR
jgi:succinoglycan biosynthesis protein ExoA